VSLLATSAESLGAVDAPSISKLIAATGDIVLMVNWDGIIRGVGIQDAELARELDADHWLDRRLSDCVTAETRNKTDRLILEAIEKQPSRWVQINHPAKRLGEIPMSYTAVQVGDAGRIVVIGRNLRAISTLQQRLMDAQQSIERDYVRLRHVETRYRLLFESTSEAVMVIDPATHRTLEANPAAVALVGNTTKQILKHGFPDLFDTRDVPAIESLLTLVKTAGRAEESAVRLADAQGEIGVFASLFRHEDASLVLVRLVPAGGPVGAVSASNIRLAMLKVLDDAPDGFVLTDEDGRIVASNAAFRDLAQIATAEQAEGSSLEQWLGRLGVDMNVLAATLRQRRTVSLFATTLSGIHGGTTDVEISAATVIQGHETFSGFVIRNVGRRIPVDPRIGRDMPRSVDQLTELIGRVPLKDLVREATDMIERLCIQAALELTRDNRASAAEMLGLSRQSLYVKLRRHGLGDLSGDGEGDA
jgi:transcriptional regulator PpsR